MFWRKYMQVPIFVKHTCILFSCWNQAVRDRWTDKARQIMRSIRTTA